MNAGLMPRLAASAAFMLAMVATWMPILPAMAEKTVPAKYARAMVKLSSGAPIQMGWGSSTAMITAHSRAIRFFMGFLLYPYPPAVQANTSDAEK